MTKFQELERPPIQLRGVACNGVEKSGVSVVARDLLPDEQIELLERLESGSARLAASRWKRVLDVVGAIGGLMCLSPLLLLVAVAIMLESPGGALFRQRRTGYLGTPFVIYKFRTMRVHEDGAQVTQAKRNDSRVTKVGLLLRRTSIDELPQLLNVLKGEMSLIGPRPHAIAHDVYYGELVAEYEARFKTKPGLTGLAQVSGFRGQTSTVKNMAERIEKDLEYIREWTFWMDIKILFRTVAVFAFHPTAY